MKCNVVQIKKKKKFLFLTLKNKNLAGKNKAEIPEEIEPQRWNAPSPLTGSQGGSTWRGRSFEADRNVVHPKAIL